MVSLGLSWRYSMILGRELGIMSEIIFDLKSLEGPSATLR
jgi:hypothetical protein